MYLHSHMNIFWQLLKTDLYIFIKESFFDSLINSIIWMACCALTIAYVYPFLGMTQDFGPFWVVGGIFSLVLFDVFGNVAHFLHHINKVSYELTLPIPPFFVLIKLACTFALQAMIYPIFMLPLLKLFLLDKINFTHFSLLKYTLISLETTLFVGFFSLLVAGMLNNIMQIRNLWGRMLFPMWFLGASQFSWYTLHKVFPIVAYINLLNPFVYAMEGIRVAVLGQQGYINFWWCILALCGFNIVFMWLAHKKLKKKLDFV